MNVSFSAIFTDWHLKVDFGKQLEYRENVMATSFCPDIVLFSETSKRVRMMELTVPWEERMEEAKGRNRAKYADPLDECRRRRWQAQCVPVEVGSKGFVGYPL